jgi:hypothetical protein
MDVRTWRVVFRSPVSDDALASLPEGLLYVSGHNVGGHLQSSTFWVRASDAGSAAQAVRDAISSAGGLSVDLLPYSVLIEIASEDVAALERALSARRRTTGLIGGLIVPAFSEGAEELQPDVAELQLDADAETAEDAATRAIEDYRELQREAGLPGRDPARIRVYPPWPGDQRRHRVLLERARELLRQGAPGATVVVAQSAVEVLVDSVIGQRLQARDVGGLRVHIMGMIRTHTLNDDRTRALWLELTGDRINQVDVWSRYRDHLKRRHEFVHRGVDVSESDAVESLHVVSAMIEHIESLPPV